jgi:alpha-amylase
MGTLKANTTWRDITGSRQDPVNLDDQGWADFPCEGGSVSVWVQA